MIAACSALNPAAAAFASAPRSSSHSTISVNPACAAIVVALTPQASASFTFAPPPTSSFADSTSPKRAANSRAVSRSVRDDLVVLRQAVRRHRHHLFPFRRSRMHVGAVRDEQLDDVRMPLRRRPHQRGLLTCRASVRVGALGEQQRDDVGFAGSRRNHQRCFAGQQCEIGIGAGIEQPPRDRRAGIQACVPQRRRAEIVGGVDPGPGAQQQIDACRRDRDTPPSAARSCHRPRRR